jgi:hypothetical protein
LRITRRVAQEHHITIPRHTALRVGTLASIVADVAAHLEIIREESRQRLFG